MNPEGNTIKEILASILHLQKDTTSLRDGELKRELKGEVTLSDGSFARYYKTKAGHQINAYDPNTMRFVAGLIMQLVEIDDKPITWNYLINLDVRDFTTLAVKIGEGN